MSIDERDFGNKIRARREELNLSQQDLAVALGLDQGKVSLIERGARKVDVVKELPPLAKVLRKPITWFFEEADVPKVQSPAEALLREYFPDICFTDFEIKKLEGFLQPVLEGYLQHHPAMDKKIQNQ